MKAVVFRGVGDVALESVPEPKIQQPTDAIIRITASAICGTDLHFVRGTLPGVKEGRILGHEAVGIVEEAGKSVRNLRKGDRVVVASTVGCGSCTYCRAGYHSQCGVANPNGPGAGTVFFGGQRLRVGSTVCRQSSRGFHLPAQPWSSCLKRSPTIRQCSCRTSCPPPTWLRSWRK